MKKAYIYSAALMALMSTASLTAQTVQKVVVGESTGFGITYSLPRTLIAVTVEAECVDVEAGDYASYAERYLGVKDAAQVDGQVWTLVGVSVASVAEPDTSRTYQIKFDKGSNPTCYLTEKGILWSLNMAPTAADEEPVEEETVVAEPTRVQVTNAELLKAGSKAKQAEIAAGQVFRIRESRLDLLTGEADNQPADGAAYKLVLENLEAQESAYVALFTGRQTVRRVKRVFYLDASGAVQKQVLTRFSKYYGFVDTDDLSGEPLTISLAVKEDLKAAQVAAQAAQGKKQSSKASGIAYIKPGKAAVDVQFRGKTMASDEVYMGQFGAVEQLPASLFVDKKNVVKATFNPATGAINLYEQ